MLHSFPRDVCHLLETPSICMKLPRNHARRLLLLQFLSSRSKTAHTTRNEYLDSVEPFRPLNSSFSCYRYNWCLLMYTRLCNFSVLVKFLIWENQISFIKEDDDYVYISPCKPVILYHLVMILCIFVSVYQLLCSIAFCTFYGHTSYCYYLWLNYREQVYMLHTVK